MVYRFSQNGKLGHSCVRDHVHLGLNVNSSAQVCGVMATILSIIIITTIIKSTKVQTLRAPMHLHNTYCLCSSLSKVCSCVSEALMLAMRVLFCSSLSKVCFCVSELLMPAMRILLFSCLLNVSSRDSKALCVSRDC